MSAARAVKARQARRGRHHPVLWYFSDRAVLPDPVAMVARLPAGLCGVVLRDDDAADRAGLGRRLARACRARRIPLVVAGDVRLARALGAGLHRRARRQAGAWPVLRAGTWRTVSAHSRQELRRAAGADLVFLSPTFPTASHPGARALGPRAWTGLARCGLPVLALGGVTGQTARRLGRACAGYAAIRALVS